MACEELATLLKELDTAERSVDTRENRVEDLIERIRRHREQHAQSDYKPTVQ